MGQTIPVEPATERTEMRLAVRYLGAEPERGRMSALDVGPAILGLGEMVGEASRVLYGEDKRVRVEVRADFAHASFGIEFFAIAPLANLLGGLTLEQLANIATILGFSAGTAYGAWKGLLSLLRWQRGRKIEKVERTGDVVRITVIEGGVQSTQNITVNEYKIFVDPAIRKGLKAVVAPLEKEGVDEVELQSGTETPVRIERQERKAFLDAPLPEEEIAVDTYTATLEVVSIAFRENYQWRFSQGGSVFFAEITDAKFLDDVSKSRERFGAGDVLRCKTEVRTTRTVEGPRFKHVILEVLEHIPAQGRADDQLPLLPPPPDVDAV